MVTNINVIFFFGRTNACVSVLMRRGTCAAKTRISLLLLFLQYGMNKLLEPEFHRGEVSCVTGRHEDDHTDHNS